MARIASACGRLGSRRGRAAAAVPRPAPHDPPAGLVGGGNPPRPGEATLAHRGVLFLDELCEFRRDALEALRAPLEDGLGLDRARPATGELPCRFMLVAAANPCPCGRGEAGPMHLRAGRDARATGAKLSGALADRIDILAAVGQPARPRSAAAPGEASAAVRERVLAARERQERGSAPGRCNAR